MSADLSHHIPSQSPPNVRDDNLERVSTPSPPPTPNTFHILESTPVKGKVSSREQYTTNSPHERLTKRTQAANEMQASFTQLSLDEFMEMFVPGEDPSPEERVKFISFSKVLPHENESAMYPGFCDSLKSVLDVLPDCGLVFKDTANWPDSSVDGPGDDLKPDIGIYPNSQVAECTYNLTDKELERSKADEKKDQHLDSRRRHMARVSWTYLCVPFEFKRSPDNAAFGFNDTDPEKMLNNTVPGVEAQGQICEYAAQLLLRQHRIFAFMVYVADSKARLVYWDRAGAVVSEPFDYIDHPDKMQTFTYRLGKMNDVQRGYDPTVNRARQLDHKAWQDAKKNATDKQKEYMKEMRSTGYPLCRVQFRPDDFASDAEGRKEYAFIIGRPRFSHRSPTGRATRGYVALDLDTRKFVFLKDSWRADSDRVRPEGDVYQLLHSKGVRHIATLICSGDVRTSDSEDVQRTRTQVLDPSLDGRVHTRLVQKQIGRPLEMYTNSAEMIEIIYHALLAHLDAWSLAGVLHRDISPGNILIDDDPDYSDYYIDPNQPKRPVGFLNDWDLCEYRVDMERGETQRGRSGTWHFMSALLQQNPRKLCAVSDDMESFVHVVKWLALKYHKHGCMPSLLESYVFNVYEDFALEKGTYIGCSAKLNEMQHALWSYRLESGEQSLEHLIIQLLGLCKEHYAAVEADILPCPPLPSGPPVHLMIPFLSQDQRDQPGWQPVLQQAFTEPKEVHRPPLETHAGIFDVFETALERPCICSRKLEDQFAGFTRRTRLLSSLPNTGSKRKVGDSELDSSNLKANKIRRLAGPGQASSHGPAALGPSESPESHLEPVGEVEEQY